MRLTKFFGFAFFVTILALGYVHQQTSLVITSYKVKAQEERFAQLLDRKMDLLYNVNKLESPGRLRAELKSHNVELAMPRREQLVVLAKTSKEAQAPFTTLAKLPGPFVRIAKNIISGAKAEASTVQAPRPRQ